MTIAYHIKQCGTSYIFVDSVGSKTQCLVAVLDGADLLPADNCSTRKPTSRHQTPTTSISQLDRWWWGSLSCRHNSSPLCLPRQWAPLYQQPWTTVSQTSAKNWSFAPTPFQVCVLHMPSSPRTTQKQAAPAFLSCPNSGTNSRNHPRVTLDFASLHAYLGVLGVHMHSDLWHRPWPCRDQRGPIADGCVTWIIVWFSWCYSCGGRKAVLVTGWVMIQWLDSLTCALCRRAVVVTSCIQDSNPFVSVWNLKLSGYHKSFSLAQLPPVQRVCIYPGRSIRSEWYYWLWRRSRKTSKMQSLSNVLSVAIGVVFPPRL